MKSMNLRLNLMKWACVVLALAAVACDDDKKKTLPGGETTEGERTRTFFSNDYASGWKYFSFKKGNFIETPAKPNESLDWDVAFNRYYVKTNSGTSGKGKGGCIDSEETGFDAVTVDKNAAFTVDDSLSIMTTMGKNGKDSYNPEIECEGSNSWAWYKYMEGVWYYNHHVFIFRSADGQNCAKVIFDTYKDQMGNSGHITFRYIYDGEQDADIEQPKEPEQPEEPAPAGVTKDTVVSNYMGGHRWHYYSFAKGELVDMTDEEAAESLEWDIAFDRNYIRTNSGEGNGGALDMNKTEFDDVPNLPTSGYEKDKTATIQNSPMSSQKEIETAINPAFVCHEVEGTWFYVAGMGGEYEYNNNVFGILCADGTTKAKLIMRSYGSSQIIFEFVSCTLKWLLDSSMISPR